MAKSASDAQNERANAGWASTAKKQRLALQSISDHIAKNEKDPEKALQWVTVQKELLVVMESMNKAFREHDALWDEKLDKEPEKKADGAQGS